MAREKVMKIRVWGLAAGWRTTAEAAHGAFAVQDYETDDYPSKDWLRVIAVERIKQ